MTGLFLVTLLTLLDFWGPYCPLDMASVGPICMDRFEAPNLKGSKPLVMQSALDGQKWCGSRGKRLCAEEEWTRACYLVPKDACNNSQMWLEWDESTVYKPSEIARLWQGSKSGSYPKCRTPAGIYDLRGNVEEWVRSNQNGKGRDWPYALKGGWWAKKTPCYKANDAHHPSFRVYETGFRCCSGAMAAEAKWPAVIARLEPFRGSAVVARLSDFASTIARKQVFESATFDGHTTDAISRDGIERAQIWMLAHVLLGEFAGTFQSLELPSLAEAVTGQVFDFDAHDSVTP